MYMYHNKLGLVSLAPVPSSHRRRRKQRFKNKTKNKIHFFYNANYPVANIATFDGFSRFDPINEENSKMESDGKKFAQPGSDPTLV